MRKWLVYLVLGVLIVGGGWAVFLEDATKKVGVLPLQQIERVAQEVTGDPDVLVQIIDGYLYVVYHLPEDRNGTMLETYHAHVGAFMRQFAPISPRLWYAEAHLAARGRVAGNPDVMIGFASYDKDLVDATVWQGLTDAEIVALATRYRVNQTIQE
jgi:hypothetical protein